MFLDANNLYGSAMSKPLPKRDFKWTRVMPSEEEILKKKRTQGIGGFLRLILNIQQNCMAQQLSSGTGEKGRKKMSDYQRSFMNDLELTFPDTKKLLLALEDKNNYVVHYRNLQFYLIQAMKLKKKVHRALEFQQESWMEPYIRMNTEFRKRAANDFEKNFYKLMNNSVFNKTMENLRNRVDIKIVHSYEADEVRRSVAIPLYSRHVMFSNNLVRIDMHKSKLLLNKPVYTRMTILDNSKILMYDFFYNKLKRQYGPKYELSYTDTDSLLLEIETDTTFTKTSPQTNSCTTPAIPQNITPCSQTETKRFWAK